MGDAYYERYPGDYLRDTRHLTVTQHGAYGLLLDIYYSTGKPLPPDVALLARMVGCQSKLEREAVALVVGEFFPVAGDGLRHNARCDKEIAKRAEFISEQSRKGRLSADSRQQQRLNRGSTVVEPEYQPDGQPKLNPPSPSPSPSVKDPTPTPVLLGVGFTDFWKIYPRKTGRDAACRAWVSMVQNGDAQKILDALAWQTESEQWTKDDGKFVPSGEKYLFDRLWTDERPANIGPSKEAKAAFFTARKVVE